MSEREKNAEIVRAVVANADLDGLDRFMAQYARVAVCEWLIGDYKRWIAEQAGR